MQASLANKETKQLLQSRVHALQQAGFSSVMLAHLGELNQDLINSLTVNVEEMMLSAGDRKPLIKRVFSILIEGLQNILLHGERNENEQSALVIVAHNETSYRVVIGNIAKSVDQDKLTGTITKLNEMDDDQVKAFYLEVLNNGLISEKGGAGLGFITMRMKSKSQLKYEFNAINDELTFFTIETFLERNSAS